MTRIYSLVSLLQRMTNAIGDVVIGGCGSLTMALLVSASVLAVVIVGLFRLTDRAEQIRSTRDRLLARTLELLLFGHEGRGLLTASGRILVANFVYLRQFVRPVCVSFVPITLLLMEGAAWFAHRPFHVSEVIVVEFQLAPGLPVASTPLRLSTSDGLSLTAGPVRHSRLNEASYRLVGTQSGEGWIELQLPEHSIRQRIVIGERLERLATERRQADDWQSLLQPGERPLPAATPVARITTHYPPRTWTWGMTEYDACIVGLVAALAISLIVARVFRVSLV